MSLIVIKDVYIEYEKTVNALIALTNKEGYQSSERREETLKFHKRALRELEEKIESSRDSSQFMGWAQRSSAAYKLFVYGEHYAKRFSVNSPINDFEVLAAECFDKLKYLTSGKCLELYWK